MTEKLNRTIKALSLKRIEDGSIGFMTKEEDKWFNVSAETDILKEIVKDVLAKGNIIEFEYNNGVVGSITLIEKGQEKEENWADEMTNFKDLLNSAHEKFGNKFNIKTEMLSVDYENKQAIFNACVSIENGEKVRIFTAHGDAEGITNNMIKPHFIRMAETRSIVRALRFATNNAKVSQEEL